MDYADSCTSRNCTDRTTNYEDRLGVEYYGTIMLSVIPVPAAVWLFDSGLIGLIGSLCLNGTFSFDQYFNGVGVSNCSIAIHDPLYAPVIEE